MKVILKQNIKKVGEIGDIVEVSNGFARNFLIPQGKAISYSLGNFKQVEYLKKKELANKEKELNEAKDLAEKLDNISLEIKVKAGKEGKLFGSITSKDITDVIVSEYNIELDRKKIDLKEPLKKLGIYNIPINLYRGVVPQIKVNLISDYLSEQETKKE